MSEDGEARFREPKTVYDQRDWVEKVIPSSTKYKNKWAVAIFDEWQISRSVIAPVLDPGGLFKGYDLHKGHTAFNQHWRNWCGDLELLD